MKLIILFAFFAVSAQSYADVLDSDGILRKDDGSIRYLNKYDAEKACPEGTHLPTVRELAKFSQARGAKGILEVSQVDPDNFPAGYYKISSKIHTWESKQTDEFYFNHEGYRRPTGDLGDQWFWSRSVHLEWDYMQGFNLSGYSGGIYSSVIRDLYYQAVLCVADE